MFLLVVLISQDQLILGDINNDGLINIYDVVLLVDIALTDGADYSEDEIWSSDVNADNETNIIDAIILIEVILLIYEECPENYSPCSHNLTECCLDSTSHDFEWFIDTLGIYGSWIHDITIIDSNNIWAVGQIVMSETYDDIYNVAHWNGLAWELFRITVPPYYVFSEPYSIFALSPTDIWIGSNVPKRYNGEFWYQVLPEDGWENGWNFDGYIRKIWGTSDDNLYFIGDNGSIVNYNGIDYTLMESGTSVNLVDIHGTIDGEHVFVSGWNYEGGTVVLELNSEIDGWQVIYEDDSIPQPDIGDYGDIYSIEVIDTILFCLTAYGIWKYDYTDSSTSFLPSDVTNSDELQIEAIEANGQNDLVLIASSGELIHYNGTSWYLDNFIRSYLNNCNVQLCCGSFFNDIITGAGYCNNKAVIFRGYRN